MADYGLRVYQGYGAERSAEDAAEWFRKSALAGDSEGQFLYAFTLAKGDGVEASLEDAYYWVLKSNESGVESYDSDRTTLKEGLEGKLDLAAQDRVKARL